MWANTNTHARSILLWIIDPNTFNFVRDPVLCDGFGTYGHVSAAFEMMSTWNACICAFECNTQIHIQMTAHYEHTRTCSIQNHVCDYLRLWYLLDDKRTHTNTTLSECVLKCCILDIVLLNTERIQSFQQTFVISEIQFIINSRCKVYIQSKVSIALNRCHSLEVMIILVSLLYVSIFTLTILHSYSQKHPKCSQLFMTVHKDAFVIR